ncbi:hypothetical protein EV175_005743, partial [Coemansia sp. RSA 1933]
MNSLVPMDLALGLPTFNSQLGIGSTGATSSTSDPSSSALTAFSPISEIAALQARISSPGPFVLGLQPDFLQQLNPLYQAQVGAAAIGTTPTFSNSTLHSPLTSSSPNQMVSSAMDASHVANLPTSAFASLNLVNRLDMQSSPQSASSMLQEPVVSGNSNSNMVAMLANSALSQVPAGAVNSSSSTGASVLAEMMQRGQRVMSPAMTNSPAMLSLQQLSALGGGGGTGQAIGARQNSLPTAQGHQVSVDTGSSADGRPVTLSTSRGMFSPPIVSESGGTSQCHFDSNLNVQIPQRERFTSINFANSLLSSSSLGCAESNVGDTLSPERQEELRQMHLIYGKQASSSTPRITYSIGGRGPAATTPSLSVASTTLADGSRNSATSSPHLLKESPVTGSPVAAAGTLRSSACARIGQMNRDKIPQMLKDAVEEHPELGCPELIYNLLIIHVVHDCSRIGIYQAHLFWMRVGEYKLPKFHLYASIADASRSWSLPDDLRAALPPNLDEICYTLAIEQAPTDDSDLQIISAIGLLILASYEFKSARFAPMVEHNCLAYKIIVQVKFRGAPFPWRAAKKKPDESGVDSNYEALLRAFWRLSLSLYYATEIFRIDAPEDRDFLPEMPKGDDYFVQRVFVVDPAG